MTTIRRAAVADADALSAIGAATFTESFGHLYPPEDTAAFLVGTHGREKLARELADPAMAAWLAEADGEVVGYAAVGPCALPHPEVTAACGELKRLYVLRPWHGDGTGARLMAEALAWLEAAGPRMLWIGVWSGNPRAQRFYARHGFARVGEYQFRVGRVLDDEFILRRGS